MPKGVDADADDDSEGKIHSVNTYMYHRQGSWNILCCSPEVKKADNIQSDDHQ